MNKKEVQLKEELIEIDNQIRAEQKVVIYDTKEYTVEVLVNLFKKGELFVPSYQRHYVWQDQRKRKFIESIIIGLPIPFMFCAECEDAKYEIIDGVQRIKTLVSFIEDGIELKNLSKLGLLNGQRFSDLPEPQQRKFKNRSLRVIALSEAADSQVRFDLFERINTGSDILKDSELRKGAYQGPFYHFIAKCADNKLFNKLCPVSPSKKDRGEREELVLRYFAYFDKYQKFDHSVKDFLDEYLQEKNKDFDEKIMNLQFEKMLKFVERHFPAGFAKTKNANTTPRVRFEAISVGVSLALKKKPDLEVTNVNFTKSEKFSKETTSDGSNSKVKLKSRVEYVRDRLIEAEL